MVYTYIFLSVFFIFLLILIIPIRIKFNYELNTDFVKSKDEENLNTLNSVDIYFLKYIKVARINSKNVQKAKMSRRLLSKLIFDIVYKLFLEVLNFQKMEDALLTKKDLKLFLKNIYFEKLHLNLGINLKNIIANVYAISFFNAVINMYFAKNADKINLEDTSYLTFISNKMFNIKIESIIRLRLANTIHIIIKVFFKFRKVVKKDGSRTSNRKFNDDCYDIS